jgi:hypothetical protein
VDTSEPLPAQVPTGEVAIKPLSNKSPRVYEWTCAYCGHLFKTSYYTQRYCKPYHKKLAYLARRAERDP